MRRIQSIIHVSILGVIALLASCAATDVVAKHAALSFGKAAARLGAAEPDGAGAVILKTAGGDAFSLAAGDGRAVAAALELDAAPFLAAGLRREALAGAWSLEGGALVGRFEYPAGAVASARPATAAAVLAAVAKAEPKRVGYHAPMKHYGLSLSDEAMVEWAADLEANDKDWVFALDPAFVRSTGADPASVAGWSLAKVPVEGPDGSMIEKELLLRPFDLR